MRTTSGETPLYPGRDIRALKEDFVKLAEFARRLGVSVTHDSGNSWFDPQRMLINIDTKTVIPGGGFVSVAMLADEYLHAWNQVTGRGRFLDPRAAKEHIEAGRIARSSGTKALGTHRNVSFHKLEALNFVKSGHDVPGFVWKLPLDDLRSYAQSWEIHHR